MTTIRSVTDFNRRVPVGTPCIYTPVRGDPGSAVVTNTRSAAWALDSGHVVVLLQGRAGGCSIAHLSFQPETFLYP